VRIDVLHREIGLRGVAHEVQARVPAHEPRGRDRQIDRPALGLEGLDEIEVVGGDVNLLLLPQRGVGPEVGADGADLLNRRGQRRCRGRLPAPITQKWIAPSGREW
jgi:hypothetical protein